MGQHGPRPWAGAAAGRALACRRPTACAQRSPCPRAGAAAWPRTAQAAGTDAWHKASMHLLLRACADGRTLALRPCTLRRRCIPPARLRRLWASSERACMRAAWLLAGVHCLGRVAAGTDHTRPICSRSRRPPDPQAAWTGLVTTARVRAAWVPPGVHYLDKVAAGMERPGPLPLPAGATEGSYLHRCAQRARRGSFLLRKGCCGHEHAGAWQPACCCCCCCRCQSQGRLPCRMRAGSLPLGQRARCDRALLCCPGPCRRPGPGRARPPSRAAGAQRAQRAQRAATTPRSPPGAHVRPAQGLRACQPILTRQDACSIPDAWQP